jgi:hypothetical protein
LGFAAWRRLTNDVSLLTYPPLFIQRGLASDSYHAHKKRPHTSKHKPGFKRATNGAAEDHRLGLVLSLNNLGRLLALHRRLAVRSNQAHHRRHRHAGLSVLQTRFVTDEILISVFTLLTTPVTFILLVHAALYRDCAEDSKAVPPMD